MVVVRDAQVRAVAQPMRAAFAERLVARLTKKFPDACAALGEEGTRAAIWHGMERADAHGLEVDRDVCAYVDLTFMFGRDFDVTLPWAAEALEKPAGARMDALHAAA